MPDTWNDTRRRIDMLQREFRLSRLDRADICCRLLRQDVSLNLPIACEAVETILALRQRVKELERIAGERAEQITELRDMLTEEVTDV